MFYRRIIVPGFILVLCAFHLEALDLSHTEAASVKQQLVGPGTWRSRRTGTATQGWHIQLKRLDDDSLSGRITIVGSPLIQQARIEGQISGRDVYGVIVGDDNVQVATFSGSVFKSGMSGTYTTTDGDSGNWSWDGSLPDDQPPTSTVEPPTLQTQ
jgi:hypothetical protein